MHVRDEVCPVRLVAYDIIGGVYMLRLDAGGFVVARKVLIWQ